ncbi:MAG: peroxidase family protein [Chloroflexota bacterium]
MTRHLRPARSREIQPRGGAGMKKSIVIGALAGAAAALLAQQARSRRREPRSRFSAPDDSVVSRSLRSVFGAVNRKAQWHQLPFPLAVANLIAVRDTLRQENLHDTEEIPQTDAPLPEEYRAARTADGSYNDPDYPDMGKAGMRFARNIPLRYAYPDQGRMLTPNPRTVSQQLLTRDEFKPVPSLNVLAAAWLQMNVHDWFDHGPNETDNPIEVPLASDDPWHENPMRVPRTRHDPTWSPAEGRPPTFRNTEAHWWGSSQIYGSTREIMDRLRSGERGKLKLENGLLPVDPETGVDISGVTNNWWIGLSLMHNLFTLEHNAICDRLAGEYPHFSDDDLYDRARLINSALMAKIHTVEWTPGILDNRVLRYGMNGNWWGALGEGFRRRFGRVGDSEILSGIPGSSTDHHTGFYAMTEEFVAVYRMHALMPDHFSLRSHADDRVLQEHDLDGVTFENARKRAEEVSFENAFYSLGTSHPGAITLHNFPRSLQKMTDSSGTVIDLAAVDILRDRERGVPRYNQFRRLMHMPPIRSFNELTDDPVWAEELRDVYENDIEMVDPMIGMYAETPPPGFGFSDTAFRIFILMASRRLKSDRYFTVDYRPEIYTQAGMDWINNNTMASVILRHFPALAGSLKPDMNAFAPWKRRG